MKIYLFPFFGTRAGGFRCDITVLEDDQNINLTNRYVRSSCTIWDAVRHF